MSEQVVIDPRFRGPPESANGGYACGVVARLIGGTAEVTLRRPPPVGRALEVQRLDGGAVVLRDGETLVAEGVPTTLDLPVPDPVGYVGATIVAKAHHKHPSPGCFVCGSERSEGDGLRIFPGRVEGRDIVAAPWIPDASLADEYGKVRPEIVWAALDCPGGFAVGFPEVRSVLGRLAARLIEPVKCQERYVAIGWPLGSEGRKLYAGSALFSQDGTLHAIGRATWVKL